MYPRTVTEKILQCQAKGLSGYETQQFLLKKDNLKIHLNTIYNHRKGAVSQEIINETLRQQQFSIALADERQPALALKYRNELLKILMPQKLEQKIEGALKLDISKQLDEVIKFSREDTKEDVE